MHAYIFTLTQTAQHLGSYDIAHPLPSIDHITQWSDEVLIAQARKAIWCLRSARARGDHTNEAHVLDQGKVLKQEMKRRGLL